MKLFRLRIMKPNDVVTRNGTEKIKLPRTLESTIFEIALVVITVVAWILILRTTKSLNEPVPTHFDINGTPNRFGELKEYYIMSAFLNVMALFMMFFVAYRPGYVNVGGKTEASDMSQCRLKGQFTRVLSLLLALLPLGVLYAILYGSIVYVVILGVLTMITSIVYSILIHRKR